MSWNPDSDGTLVTQLDILEATESELLDVRDRADLDLEMDSIGSCN